MDETLLAVNKPAGLPTLPDGYQADSPCLVGALKARFGALWVVHRLDRGTSGVVLFARNADAHRALNTQFEQHTIHKLYHALAQGTPPWDDYVADMPLRPNGDRRHRTVVDAHKGKPAVTRLRVLERFDGYSLVAATPETGRTHQIRVHLAVLGYPLAADPLYARWHAAGSMAQADETPAAPRVVAVIERTGLHAQLLTVTHPATGAPLVIEASYPEDFAAALARLRAPAAR